MHCLDFWHCLIEGNRFLFRLTETVFTQSMVSYVIVYPGSSYTISYITLQWRHNGRDSVSNHQPHHSLLNGLFRRKSKKTSTLRVTGLCAGNSPETGEFPAQMASNAENVFILCRYHEILNKMTDILQMTFSNAFSWKNNLVLWFRFQLGLMYQTCFW